MNFTEDFLEQIRPRLDKAFNAMDELEAGAIANPDENRMVGHYWLRNSILAPTGDITAAIDQALADIKAFAAKVHNGEIRGAEGPFENFLIIGIGGSALGPQFVARALTKPGKDKMTAWFIDNTDPDEIDRIKAKLANSLSKTLVIVISKSGGTKETRNGMLEMQHAYQAAGLNFAEHAVAVTGDGSNLDNIAATEGWIQRFPMWDWIGGRTSETSAVGLLPLVLQGFDIDDLLAGAAACDAVTRAKSFVDNPAGQLAVMWFYAVDGRGSKTWLSYHTKIGSGYFRSTCSNSSWSRLARNATSAAKSSTRASQFTATKDLQISTPTSSNCAKAYTTFSLHSSGC